jgi:hypothetical protein
VKTRIYIGTARGPVLVERIWREEGIAESMVCLKRTTEILPIGAGYDAFVKRPSGIIERAFGPFEAGGFRLELGERITQGASWQLAVFVAHALARDGMLAGPDDEFDRAVWLTGQVDNDLKTGAVDQVPEKIHAALGPLGELTAAGKEVSLFVPEDNVSALSSAAIPSGISARAAASAIDVLNALAIPLERREATPQPAAVKPVRAARKAEAEDAPDRHRTKRNLVGTAFLLLGGGAIAAGIILPRVMTPNEPLPEVIEAIEKRIAESKAPPAPAPQPAANDQTEPKPEPQPDPQPEPTTTPAPRLPTPSVTISEIRAAPDSGCPAVHVGASDGIATELMPAAGGDYASSAGAGLCAIAFTVTPPPGQPYVALAIELITGRYVEIDPLPDALKGAAPVTAPLTWRINIPISPKTALDYKLHLISAANAIPEHIVNSLKSGDFPADQAILTARHSVAP